MAVLFVSVITSAGVVVGTQIAPGIKKESIETCFDNAKHAQKDAETAIELARTALKVAEQHGAELENAHARITEAFKDMEKVEDFAKERTALVYTPVEAHKRDMVWEERNRRSADRDAAHERRLANIERELDRMEKRVKGAD